MQLIQINREKGPEDRRVCTFLKSSLAYSHAFIPHILEYPVYAARIILLNPQKRETEAQNRNYTLNNLGTARGTLLYQSASWDSFRILTVWDQIWFSHTFHNQMLFSHFHKTYTVLLTDAYNFSDDLKHTQCLEEGFCNTQNKQLSLFNQQIKHMFKSRSYFSCLRRWNLMESGSSWEDDKYELTPILPGLQPLTALQFNKPVAEVLKESDQCMTQLLHVAKRKANHLSSFRQELIRKELLY